MCVLSFALFVFLGVNHSDASQIDDIAWTFFPLGCPRAFGTAGTTRAKNLH